MGKLKPSEFKINLYLEQNMEEKAYFYQLKDFDVRLTLENDAVVIDLLDTETLKNFSIKLTKEEVDELTEHFFSDLRTFQKALIECFEGKNPDGELRITKEPKLSYSAAISLGSDRKSTRLNSSH